MSGAKVLVVDAGGRGNAIAHAFARSPLVERVYVAPGNAGSSMMAKCEIALSRGTPIKEIPNLVSFARAEGIDLTFVGPEGYLSDGIVNVFSKEGLEIVGPQREATILEGSKCDTKDFLRAIGVPIPRHQNFSNPDEAKEYASAFYRDNPKKNLVVKADGLAAGKGSIVCSSREEAVSTIERIMVEPKLFGDAGRRVDIEERLAGRELMFFAVTDGRTVLPLESAMDYKRAFSPDEGVAIRLFNKLSGNPNLENNPNTGGMGGYSPHPWLDSDLMDRIMETIAVPTIKGFKEVTGFEYSGMIYFGLMICEEGGEKVPKVLEINVRLGDPEAEVILPRLETDMYLLSRAILDGELDTIDLKWSSEACVGVCAISGRVVKPVTSGAVEEERPGYPGPHYTNMPIRGLDKVDPDVLVYHNGTAFGTDAAGNEQLYTTGGRVLTVVGRGASLAEAREKTYRNVRKIRFNGIRYRKDIGLFPELAK
ncbi:MAG: Phosphoribosylamine--glycine ligase [Methanothrix harundinacea]|uniref:Phosphoribosylamine--glycine ligase n=1 Tax=Methanothrix harundinacea TaxID=301375 RepID=A0A124G338_9EURY|nr:MAG: Phosphoribosylamine--glycine ligase [Methanothrix harundinacea]